MTITKETKIPLGFAVTLGVALLTGILWIKDSMTGYELQVLELSTSIEKMNITLDNRFYVIEQGLQDKIDEHEIRDWIKILKAQNPTLQIPELTK